MSFTSVAFVGFFFAFFCVFHFVARGATAKKWTLLAGSLVFFAHAGWRWVPLLVAFGLVDFYVGERIHGTSDERAKKMWLTGGLVFDIGVLFGFKYIAFTVATVARVLHLHTGLTSLSIPSPLGLSFLTFQGVSYLVDVYRGTWKPRRDPVGFLAAFSFFPHLVSGPIFRAPKFLPQLDVDAPLPAKMMWDGVTLFAAGLLKKTLADCLSGTVDRVFSSLALPHSSIAYWTTGVAYAAQLYADFSGYTDMAIGAGLMLGYALPRNFNLPYLARSPVEFWKRWHITLSEWLRDYLFYPLSFRFPSALYLHLVTTWVLAGLWHGASYHYVLYGLYHGVLITVTIWLGENSPGALRLAMRRRAGVVFTTMITLYLVIVGDMIFRAETIHDALTVIVGMLYASAPSVPSEWMMLGIVSLALVTTHALDMLVGVLRRERTVAGYRWLFAVSCVSITLVFSGGETGFLYFKF